MIDSAAQPAARAPASAPLPREAQPKKRPPKHCDAPAELLRIADRYAQGVREFRNLLMIRHARNDHYVNGNQFIEYDPVTNQFFELDAGSEFAHVNNQLVTFVRARAAVLSKSRSKYQVTPKSTDRRARQKTRFITAFIDNQIDEQPEDERYMEGLRMVTHGRSYRREFVALTGPEVDQPVFEEEPFAATEDAYQCPDCASGGHFQAPQGEQSVDACPKCGSENASVVRAVRASVPRVTGTSKVASVAIHTQWLADYHVWWDPGAGTPAKSPWAEVRQLCVNEEVEERYPNCTGKGQRASGEDLGLEYQRMLERSPGNYDTDPYVTAEQNIAGWGGGDDLRTEVREVWLTPPLISNLVPDMDGIFPSATLRKGVPLGEQFPKGVRLVVVGNSVVDVAHEAKNDHLFDFYDGLRPNAGYARGIEDWRAIQDRINSLGTWGMTWLAMAAVGNTVINPDVITDPEMRDGFGVPGKTIQADGCLTGEDLGRAAVRIGGEPFQPAVINLEERAKGDLQTMAATYATATGVPSAPIDTATGVNAMMDQIQQLQAPVLRLRAAAEASWLRGRLRLARRYFFDPHFVRLSGGQAGTLPGKMITRDDLDGEFWIKPVEDSYLTRSAGQIRNDVAGALKLGYANPQLPEEVRGLIGKAFAIDDVEDLSAQWRLEAERRIEAVMSAAEQLTPMLAEAMAQAGNAPVQMGPDGLPVDMRAVVVQSAIDRLVEQARPDPLDEHPIFIKAYRAFRITDECREAHPLVKDVFLTLVNLHKQGIVEAAQEEQMAAIAAEAPMREASRAQAAQDHEQEQSAKDRDLERQREAANEDALRENALAEARSARRPA